MDWQGGRIRHGGPFGSCTIEFASCELTNAAERPSGLLVRFSKDHKGPLRTTKGPQGKGCHTLRTEGCCRA